MAHRTIHMEQPLLVRMVTSLSARLHDPPNHPNDENQFCICFGAPKAKHATMASSG